jgi:hybrid cluster-associated redox disulfide protein
VGGAGRIDGESVIADVLRDFPETIEVFARFGMACQGCTGAERDTVAEGAATHGATLSRLLDALNACVSQPG